MFPQRLRSSRKTKKLTQDQLAKLVNTRKTTISNYETGYSSPSNEMLADLADVLETNVDYLLGRTDDPKPIPKNEKVTTGKLEDQPEVQFIMRTKQELSPKAFEKFMELAKKTKEMFEDD